MRINFTPAVKKEIARRAMHLCSNPDCLKFTIYSTTEENARSIAEAAHINAASGKGPRSVAKDEKELKKAENGIWLCSICHTKVDNDESYYDEGMLRDWKTNHEDVLRRIVGKDLEAALLSLRNHKQYHDEARELVSYIESRRVLHEGLDMEFPPRVLESLNNIRERVSQTKAKINPDTSLFDALNKIQLAIDEFLRAIGPETDLRALRCDGRDPVWVKFSEELLKLRSGIIIILKVISSDADYKLRW
ncbi:hypothetical protein OW495_05380 [Vibrio sp. 14N.309.X.WAT.E.F5]|uniref:hypothetical protein n=1 Tax=Vibrio sp. 14N.309.X.WAT.E.F5 TaxID=2998321 RepID=UPI0025B1E12C|nr:hypothetical protein [Vibrio sp. 14N.309.X.WAT.E.F5]MDN2666139.1 hypothetical protein [Vibrio sp. 14N.309.X.WAT.E.F5]